MFLKIFIELGKCWPCIYPARMHTAGRAPIRFRQQCRWASVNYTHTEKGRRAGGLRKRLIYQMFSLLIANDAQRPPDLHLIKVKIVTKHAVIIGKSEFVSPSALFLAIRLKAALMSGPQCASSPLSLASHPFVLSQPSLHHHLSCFVPLTTSPGTALGTLQDSGRAGKTLS